MAMTKSIWMVTTRCSDPSREDEFNRWYDEVHLPDLLKVPGLAAAERYRLHERAPGFGGDSDASRPTYLALYEFEPGHPPPDLDALFSTIAAAVPDIGNRMIDCLEIISSIVLTQLGDRQVAERVGTRAEQSLARELSAPV
jgi:hypothetical protein